MTKTKAHFRAAAILLAMLMMFGTLFALMPTASAADEGKLYIHKLSDEPVTDAVAVADTSKTYYNNGIDLNYEYLAGAKYTVYKIGTFAEVNSGTSVSIVYTPHANLVMVGLATLGSATTPADINLTASKANGTGLPVAVAETNATAATGALEIATGLDANGVYLVVESTLPSGVAAGVDFIITVPMYNDTTKAWETTVNAYPKNAATDGEITKTITAIGGTTASSTDNTFYANTGDIITYEVSVDVPADYTTIDTDATQNYTQFDIIDSSSKYLELDTLGSTVAASDVTVTGTNTFTAGSDYTVTYDTTGTTNKLTVTFTTAGLAKIVASETLTVTYGAEIQAAAATSTGGVTNTASIEFTKGTSTGTITPPTPGPSDPPPVPTVKIYSYGVKKMNDASTPAPLAGASFVLATKDASGDYEYLAYDATDGEWDVVTLATADVFTTSTTGSELNSEAILQFKNLDPTVTYYLIETVAPTNYIKLLSAVEITATSTSTESVYSAYTGTTYVADKGYTVKITNVAEANGGLIGGGGLPTTGGNGIYLYLIIGAVLMGTAVVLYVKSRKKANKAEQ